MASMSLQAYDLGTIDYCLSQQSSEKLMYSCGSSFICSASALVNLIRFRQIYITIFFISARKVALYFLSPAAIARLSIN